MIFRFSQFELDENRRQLRDHGTEIHLEPRVFDLLLYLVRHRDRAVPRDELLNACWAGIVVNDGALSRAVHEARRAVGSDGANPIRTIPRRGYRFIAEVEESRGLEAGAETQLIGRSEVVQRLVHKFEDSVSGQSAVALLEGPPGIGKTACAEFLGKFVRANGGCVLYAGCRHGEGAPVLWPWIQVLRGAIRNTGTATLRNELGPAYELISDLLPGKAEPISPKSLETNPERNQFLLFDAVSQLLSTSSSRSPLLVVLEDIHDADESSLELLEFLARDRTQRRILLVATFRSESVDSSSFLRNTVTQIERQPASVRIRLEGLDHSQLQELVQQSAGFNLPTELLGVFHERTGGNPFFAGALIRLLGPRDELETKSLEELRTGLPDTVKDAIRSRLSQLPGDAQTILEIGSVVGPEFGLDLMQHLCPDLDPLKNAEDAGLVDRSAENPRDYQFSHGLIREVIYDQIPPSRRSGLHEQVGTAIEDAGPSDEDGNTEALAHHFFESVSAGGRAKAFGYAMRAGSIALRHFAPRDATVHYERALRLLESGAASRGDLCAVLVGLGRAERWNGQLQESRQRLLKAIELARSDNQVELFAQAALDLSPSSVEVMRVDEQAIQLLQEAISLCGNTRPALRGALLARLAIATYALNDEEGCCALADHSLESALESGSNEIITHALDAMYQSRLRPSRIHELPDVAQRMFSLASNLGQIGYELTARSCRFVASMSKGDVAGAKDDLRWMTEHEPELQMPLFRWMIFAARGMIALLEARWDDAAENIQACSDLEDPTENYVLQKLYIQYQTQEYSELSSVASETFNRYPDYPLAKLGASVAIVQSGNQDAAHRLYDEYAKDGFVSLIQDRAWDHAMGFATTLAETFDDKAGADALFDLLYPHRNRYALNVALCLGPISTLLARLSVVREQFDEAERYFEHGMSEAARIESPLLVAYGNYFYSGLLLRRKAHGDEGKAINALRETLRLSEPFRLRYLTREVHSRASQHQISL